MPSGVTSTYDVQDRDLGSSQADNVQTNYHSYGSAYQGTNTALPTPAQPNTTINTSRQRPQPPSVKGW
jgi:hypothetical protein